LKEERKGNFWEGEGSKREREGFIKGRECCVANVGFLQAQNLYGRVRGHFRASLHGGRATKGGIINALASTKGA